MVAVSRREKPRSESSRNGERAHFISGDVTQEGDVRSVIDGAVERFGRLDIVVNNAGGSLALSPIVDLETEDWNHTILWNLSGHVLGHQVCPETYDPTA